MQCCVPNCTSNELEPNKSENSGITYHEFPKDPQTRLKWMRDLQLEEDWTPNTDSVVCSKHFGDENIVKIELHLLEPDADVCVTKQQCRVCLCSDRKLYNIGENDIAQQYELLTASKDCLGDVLPQYICWECKARLASFARLRSVALRSLALLQEHYETHNSQETPQDSQLIVDRDTNNLASTLIQSNLEKVDYPPKTVPKKPSTVRFNLRNRNNAKSTKPTVSSKAKKTVVKKERDNFDSDDANDNDNLQNRIYLKKVKTENDNSDFSDSGDHLAKTKASSKGKNTTKVKNENDNSDIDDNFDSLDNLKDETASPKSDALKDVDDSDGSENEDSNRKVEIHLTKINTTIDKKVTPKKRAVKLERKRVKKGKSERIFTSYKELEEAFNIKQFTKEEQLNEFLQRKETDNYKNAGFKCHICYRGFLHEKTFKSHQLKHSDVNGLSKCPICGIQFRTTSKLKTHMKETHQYKYNCKKCDYITCAWSKAKMHVKFHKGTIYKCKDCDKTFKQQNSLLGHVRVHHASGIVCRLCGNSFINDKGLHNHTLLVHKLESLEVPEDGPRCVECNIQFSTDAALTTHYQQSIKHKKDGLPDSESRKRKAPTVSKPVYTNPPKVRKRGNKGPVTCELCNLELPNHWKYRFHFKEHHPDQVRTKYPGTYMCEVCGLFFSCQAVLEEHKESVHAGVKKMFICTECGKKLNTKSSLYLHTKTHFERYSCDICANTFSSYSNMHRHRILHENLRFDCNICGKSFSHPQNRQTHINFVHKKKPLPVRRNRVRVKRE